MQETYETALRWKFVLGSLSFGLADLLTEIGLRLNDPGRVVRILENKFEARTLSKFAVDESSDSVIQQILAQNKNDLDFMIINSWLREATLLSEKNRSLVALSNPLKALVGIIPLKKVTTNEFLTSGNGRIVEENIKKYLLPYSKIMEIISTNINLSVTVEKNMTSVVNLKLIFQNYSLTSLVDIFYEAIEAYTVLQFWKNTKHILSEREISVLFESILTQAKEMRIPTDLIRLPN